MIYLNNITFTDDVLFEKSRESHNKFKQKKEFVKGGRFRDKEDRTYYYFKIFEKGLSIDFTGDISMIVGDNGTGKTTLLNFMRYKAFKKSLFDDTPEQEAINKHWSKYLKSDTRTLTYHKSPEGIYLLDGLHKEAVGESLGKELDKRSFSGNGEGFAKLAAHFMFFQNVSNGEALLDIYEHLKDIKNCLIIADEPETSMSLKSVNKLCNQFKELAANGNQLIISTHHPHFMELAPQVYDIESKKYIDTGKYLESV